MMVLNLTNCPAGLRGDLTKWLFEIAPGVFVGQVSARVRDELWVRVKEMCREGRAILVYSANKEQRLDFRVHGNEWEPIDFDGIKLMMRPSRYRMKEEQRTSFQNLGFSNAAKNRAAKRFAAERLRYPSSYIVFDLETTGLNAETDEILEIGAAKIMNSEMCESFHKMIRITKTIPSQITELTGITDQMVRNDGESLQNVMMNFWSFAEKLPLIAHNVDFDRRFLHQACAKCEIPLFTNRCIDTLTLAKRLIHGLPNYKLQTLSEHFGIKQDERHRSMSDCETVWILYKKLLNLMDEVPKNEDI